MRSSLFALVLLPAAAALGQTAPLVNPPPQAQPARQFKFSVAPPQALLAQNGLPALPLDSGPASAKPQPIPTQWPNAKFELIPTQWPNARVVLVGGAGVKQETPVPASGGTVSAVPVSAAPQSPHR